MDSQAPRETIADVSPLHRLRSFTPARDSDPIGTALRDAGKGDEAAFSQFYDLTSALVYGTVLKVVRDPSIAEEVTQEVYVELWRLAPRFEAKRGSARSWAATIAIIGGPSTGFAPSKRVAIGTNATLSAKTDQAMLWSKKYSKPQPNASSGHG
ncbi:MAG: sigma factor [Acidimicrobiales bacterium]